MTIEELLDCSADKLESFTNEQLNEWFAPYLNVTRPEQATKNKASTIMRSSNSNKQKHFAEQLELNKRMDIVRKIAASKGIELDL